MYRERERGGEEEKKGEERYICIGRDGRDDDNAWGHELCTRSTYPPISIG